MKNNILCAIAGLSLALSPVAIAGTLPSEQNKKSDRTTPEMTHSPSLEKLIQENTEKKRIADTEKYTQMATLAGNRKDELEKSRDEVNNTYTIWRDLKSATETSRNINPNNFRAVEVAAQAYSQANKAFIDLQKDILEKNGVPSAEANTRIVINIIPSNAVDALNTAPATAAGSK